jgi:hypothetical protein
MRFFGLVFPESTPNRLLMKVKKYLNIFSRIGGDFGSLSAEKSQNFLQIIPWKGMPFRGVILGKSKLSADCTKEKHSFPW